MHMNTKDKLRNFIQTNPVFASSVPAELSDDYPLVEAGILDSIGTYTLMLHLEKTFCIQLDIEDLKEENFRSITAIETFIKCKNNQL